MKSFASSTRDEALLYLDEFAGQQCARLEELQRLVDASPETRPALDRSEDSLLAFWAWVLGQLGSQRPATEPSWLSLAGFAAGGLTPHDLVLAEHVGRYLAEVVLTRTPGARWALVEGRPDTMDYHHPSVVAPDLDYLPVIGTGMVQLQRALRRRMRPEPDVLARVLRNLRPRIEEGDP